MSIEKKLGEEKSVGKEEVVKKTEIATVKIHVSDSIFLPKGEVKFSPVKTLTLYFRRFSFDYDLCNETSLIYPRS
jgi:hypothetical protein